WRAANGIAWAVGGVRALVHNDGTGRTVVDRLATTGGTQYQLFGLWGSAHDDIWAVGNGGTAHHFHGQGWTYVSLPTNQEMHGVWGTAGNYVFAVGDGGVLLHFDGSAWSDLQSPDATR